MGPYRTPAPHRDDAALDEHEVALEERVIGWLVLVIGSIPFVGYVVIGRWSHAELGVAVVVVLLALCQLLRGRRPSDTG